MVKRPNRPVIIGGIVIAVIFLLTLIAAPSASKLDSGSTYNHAPDGYGAWYSFMQSRGVRIERWQRPFKDLAEQKTPGTLLLIYPSLIESGFTYEQQEWVEKGNRLLVLGVRDRANSASKSNANYHPVYRLDAITQLSLKSYQMQIQSSKFVTITQMPLMSISRFYVQ